MESKDVVEQPLNSPDLARFFEIYPNLYCVMNLDGTFVSANKAWKRIFGIQSEEICGKNFLDLFVFESYPEINKNAIIPPNKTEDTFINKFYYSDGSFRYFEWNLHFLDGLIYAMGRDITKRLEDEQALNEQRVQFELVIRGSNDGIWDWNVETNEVYFSPKFKEQLGYSNGELKNEFSTFDLLLHPDDKEAFKLKLEAYIDSLSEIFSTE